MTNNNKNNSDKIVKDFLNEIKKIETKRSKKIITILERIDKRQLDKIKKEIKEIK